MKNIKYTWTLAALLLFAAACGTGKVYTSSSPALPEHFRGADTTKPSTGNSIGSLPWKEFFTDAALRNIIDSVLKNNYDHGIALDNIRISSEFLKQAKAGFQPALSVGATASVNRFSDNSLNGPKGFDMKGFAGIGSIEDYTLQAAASWEIDIWGKIRGRKSEAMAGYLQSEAAATAFQTRLIAATAAGYYNLVMLREQLTIAHRNLSLSDSTVSMVKLQAENGDATALAVWQAETQYKEVAQLIPALEQALIVQENALSLLMAKTPGSVVIDAKAEFLRLPGNWHEGVPAALLGGRPDVKEAEEAVRAAHARMGIAKAEMYPSLSITAAGGLNSFRASDWMMLPASLFGTAAGSLLQPVLNRRQLKTAYKVADIRYEQSVKTFKSKVLAAVTEVSDALAETEKVNDRISVSEQQQDILDKAIPGSALLFENGEANYLEVITARQQSLNNQLRLADLRRQQAMAYIQLYRAVGGGVK